MPDFDQTLPIPSQNDDDNQTQAIQKVSSDEAAADLVRQKIDSIYGQNEPNVYEEEKEIESQGPHSKHQIFIQNLVNSQKSQAEIQASWHRYYSDLSTSEKHQVWDEFYKFSQSFGSDKKKTTRKGLKNIVPISSKTELLQNRFPENTGAAVLAHASLGQNSNELLLPNISSPYIGEMPGDHVDHPSPPVRSLTDTKNELINKINFRVTSSAKHNFQSLLFGLGFGLFVVFIFMFGFLNERFIAPFITPSRTASSSPIIINPTEKVSTEPRILIPKINAESPVVYDAKSTREPDIQKALESGVVHYPGTPTPGENGNVVIVGHSSNNIFNLGNHKFAFVLLKYLQTNDTMLINYQGKRYIYKVYDKIIVKPSEVSVLGPTEKTASLTLITCDPPGTNTNRLVIRAEQISPSPSSNVASTSKPLALSELPTVPGNSPSLFQRIFGWL